LPCDSSSQPDRVTSVDFSQYEAKLIILARRSHAFEHAEPVMVCGMLLFVLCSQAHDLHEKGHLSGDVYGMKVAELKAKGLQFLW